MSADTRSDVLSRIRASLGVAGDDTVRRQAVRERLDAHPRNLVPARAQGSEAERLDLFVKMLRDQSAEVTRLPALDDVPDAIARWLRDNNLPARLRLGADALLSGLPWDKTPALDLHHGRAGGEDAVGLSRATVAAAETGTLFLVSGPDNPTSVNFLPDTHIALVRAADVVGPYEDAWDRLRVLYGDGALPRAVNLISGPSRTADIEQIIVMGVHGPRRLHVILVDG